MDLRANLNSSIRSKFAEKMYQDKNILDSSITIGRQDNAAKG